MMTALWSGATGMSAQQTLLDCISNNLANVNTTGFKKQTVQFQDLYYQSLNMGEGTKASVGHGAYVAGTKRSFKECSFEIVDDPLFMAIKGQGFFQIETPQGIAYTRDGSFRLDGEGLLVTSNGYRVLGDQVIRIDGDAYDIKVSEEGDVTGVLNGSFQNFGNIRLALFSNPQGMDAIGNNLFLETRSSGSPKVFRPTDGPGSILGGCLESSNVDLVTEMVNLIVAQRAFEMSSKSVEAADQMWALANNLRS